MFCFVFIRFSHKIQGMQDSLCSFSSLHDFLNHMLSQTVSLGLLTLSCLLFSFRMLSKVYFSERLWRILKRREPRFEERDSSSSIISFGTLIFLPRSISISEDKEHKQLSLAHFIFMKYSQYYNNCKMSLWRTVGSQTVALWPTLHFTWSVIFPPFMPHANFVVPHTTYCILFVYMSPVYIWIWDI